MDDAQAVSLLLFRSHRSISSFLSLNETAVYLRVRLNIILLLSLLPLLIVLQIPLVITTETQVPTTRSCRADVAAILVATAAVAETIVVAVATVHHQEIVGDDGGVEGPVGGGANGKQAIAVDNTSGSPTVLYSNAARITAWFGGLVNAVDPLAAALGWRRRCPAVLRLVQRRLHSILHVVS